MKWLKHDTDASIDTKIKKLRRVHGIAGYGLYFYCLEQIGAAIDRDHTSFTMEDDAETIAYDWHLDVDEVQSIINTMVNLELFDIHNGQLRCLKIATRLDDTTSRHPEIKAILEKVNGHFAANLEDSEEPSEISESTSKPSEADEMRLDKMRVEQIISHDDDDAAADLPVTESESAISTVIPKTPAPAQENISPAYLDHLVKTYGYDEIRTRTRNTAQAKQWLSDGVTISELDAAYKAATAALAKKGDSRLAPISYLAKVIASSRAQESVVVSTKGTSKGNRATKRSDSKAQRMSRIQEKVLNRKANETGKCKTLEEVVCGY